MIVHRSVGVVRLVVPARARVLCLLSSLYVRRLFVCEVNAECDGASGKPQPWRGMPVPGVGLKALTSPVCAFLGLHDATTSPGAAPTGFTSSRISRWADTTEVVARPITQQTLTPQHTWARHGVCGRPRPGREFQAGPEHRAVSHLNPKP